MTKLIARAGAAALITACFLVGFLHSRYAGRAELEDRTGDPPPRASALDVLTELEPPSGWPHRPTASGEASAATERVFRTDVFV